MSMGPGVIHKDDKYLTRLTNAIKLDPTHPRHHGVKMQAHHIISAQGVAFSGRGASLVKLGYDINDLPNLVFLPCTLQGACHLGVQVHRGNHTAPVDQDKADSDADKSITYHKVVRMQLMDLSLPVAKECSTSAVNKSIEALHKVSKRILRWIQDSPGRAPLTHAAVHFSAGDPVGCGGVDSVTRLKAAPRPCPMERNHFGQQGPGQSSENIQYRGDGSYRLRPGR